MSTPTEVREYIAGEVRAAMGRREINKTALAKSLGLSIQTVSESLAGRRAFSTDELATICELLAVDFLDLFPPTSERAAS